MDGADYTDTEASNGFASDDPEVVANHAGGIFPGCQNFTVTGGTYTNILQSTDVVPSGTVLLYHAPANDHGQSTPTDFRRIPMGDIYLQDNLSGDFSTTRRHLAQRSFFRRMFSAKIPGHTSNVTVATYQGDRAEEEWREDVTRYMSFRHHNILQLFATAAMKNIYAAVFHCALVTFGDFVTYYLPPVSPIVETYVRGVWVADFWAISEYVELEGIDWNKDSVFWIQPSTGKLHTDLVSAHTYHMFQDRPQIPNLRRLDSELHAPNLEAMVIASLSIEEYEVLSYLNMYRHHILDTTLTTTFNLAAVICCSNGRMEDSVEISFLPHMSTSLGSWRAYGPRAGGCVMKDGWTRFNPNDLIPNDYNITLPLSDSPRVPYEMSTWLTQANYIFRELQIDSPFTDFVVIYHINFVVSLTEPPPETQGFLFLCPPDHFQVGPSSVRIPDFPWYWSLDPLGRERLTAVDAAARELPEVRLNARAFGRSWDERVYTGIRKFHKSKGFDPDTQDAARSLGQPLYRLSNDVDPLFAHVNELREEDDSVAGDSGSEEDESLPDDNDSDSDHSPTVEPHSTDDEVEISWSFRIIMNIQFALLLFLALSWLTGGM